jgi:hypothetical protein
VFLSFRFKKIKNNEYGTVEAMLGDLKWILHNCIIYNGGMIITTDLVRVPSIATPVLFAFDRSCKQAHRGRKKPDTDVAARDERDASVRGLLSQQHLEKP